MRPVMKSSPPKGQKIQQEARRKLSQVQLQELIEIFRTRLTSLPDPESIQQLCQAEIALLSEGYNPPSVANNYLPKYRQAIAFRLNPLLHSLKYS